MAGSGYLTVGRRMCDRVFGLASIVGAGEYDGMGKMNVEKAFGVPGGVVAGAALAWLDGLFGQHSRRFDRAAVRATASVMLAGPA